MYAGAIEEFFEEVTGNSDEVLGEQSENSESPENATDNLLVDERNDVDDNVPVDNDTTVSDVNTQEVVEQLVLMNQKLDMLCTYSVYTMVLCLFLFCALLIKGLWGIIKDIFYNAI